MAILFGLPVPMGSSFEEVMYPPAGWLFFGSQQLLHVLAVMLGWLVEKLGQGELFHFLPHVGGIYM